MSYRPISLKLNNYEKPRLLQRFNQNKENLYAIPRRPYKPLCRADSDSELPTTSTQVGRMEPVCFEKHLRERELFSTSSSLSDDELEFSRKKKRERFSTHYSTSDLTTSDSSIGPSWITSNGHYIRIPPFRHNLANSTTSLECSDNLRQEFENDDEENEDEDHEIGEEINTKIDKRPLVQDLRRLESIEEMSPVLPVPSNIHDDQDLPPQITPLRFAPSTGAAIRFPNTNPYHQQPITITPHLSSRRLAFDQPRSLFELKPMRSEEFGLPSQMAKHYGSKGIIFMTITMAGLRSKTQLNVFVQHGTYFLQRYPELSTYVTVEIKYNKRFKKRNKATANLPVYLSSLVRRTHQPDFNYDVGLLLTEENFRSHDKLGISVYANSSDDFSGGPSKHDELLGCMTFSLRRLREKAKHSLNGHYKSEESRVKVCDGGYFLLNADSGEYTNMPQDKVYHRKYYDEIGSTFPTTFESPPKMIGESDWRTALNYKDSKMNDPRRHSIQVGTSQRIPLNGRPTSSNNQHYYPSATTQQQQYYLGNNGTEIPVSSSKNEHRYGPLSALISGSPRKKVSLQSRTISTDQHHQRRKEQHVSSGSSMSKGSSNSSSSSSAGYKSHYRFTLPSITTTTTDSSDCANGSSNLLTEEQTRKQVDQKLLYADVAPPTAPQHQFAKPVKARSNTQKALPTASSHRFLSNQPSVSSDNDKVAHHNVVRRVASFTYSTDDKLNKQAGKKFNFAPITKIGSLIRGKVDSTNSTSALYPTKDDVRVWAHSFESLLRDKYGRHLFRQFVTREVSSENLDFYEDVEEFKKLKPGKKTTIQKANEIYNTYFVEGAAKELNLDSQTKNSTKTAFKNGTLPDTFNLAQSKIEQLMSKDSYARFIHSKPYLDLLNSSTPPQSASHSSVPPNLPSTASIETSESKSELQLKSKSESPVNDSPVITSSENKN